MTPGDDGRDTAVYDPYSEPRYRTLPLTVSVELVEQLAAGVAVSRLQVTEHDGRWNFVLTESTSDSELADERDRWRTAWEEERRARIAAEGAASTASRDAIRVRDGAGLALDELRTPGLPAARAIAEAGSTLANALAGRPLAQRSSEEPS